MILFKPKFVKYFDTSYEINRNEYIVNIENGRTYLCSELTYKLAKEITKENELYNINTRSLPSEWCKYTELNDTKFRVRIPSIIENNYNKLMEIIQNNFDSISRICDFLEEFYEYSVEKDFNRCCQVGWAITHNNVSDDLLQELFNIVFSQYAVKLEEQKLQLLLDINLSPFLIKFEDCYR